MVNLGICAKCPKCTKVEPSIVDRETDKLLALPSVRCSMVDDTMLLTSSILPKNCIFVLEHTVTQPDTRKLIEVTRIVVEQDAMVVKQDARSRQSTTLPKGRGL